MESYPRVSSIQPIAVKPLPCDGIFIVKFNDLNPVRDDIAITSTNQNLNTSLINTGAEASSFNRQPQAYALSQIRVRLRLTVKRFLTKYRYIGA